MPSSNSNPLPGFRSTRLLLGGLLLIHCMAVLMNWRSESLVANGFREAQTAVSALFIQRDQDFSLAYPTPVLGRPWSIPMEFPLYQWTTVKLSDVTGLPLVAAGRLIALGCFYLTLPALYLLLRRAGVEPWRSLLALGFVLSCPLYLFYGRAFLIETMALMFSAWFLLGLVQAVERHSWRWLLLAWFAGTAAALVKITTLVPFLVPAGCWWLWIARRELRTRSDGRVRTLGACTGWFLAALLPAFLAGAWWVGYADAIKAGSAAGSFLTSENLRGFNFGFGGRFTAETWRQHWDIWFGEIIYWPAGAVAIAVIIAVQRDRLLWGLMAVMLASFLVVQTVFPLLYAYHAYYYLANAFLPMLALGLGLSGLWDRRLPRGIIFAIIAGFHIAQAAFCWRQHGAAMQEMTPWNVQFTEALKRSTAPDEVLLVAGDDWSSVIPYYTGRRALLLRNGIEDQREQLERALGAIEGEPVGALVLRDRLRDNRALLDLAIQRHGFATEPTFKWFNTDVYLRPGKHEAMRAWLLATERLPQITVPGGQAEIVNREVEMDAVPLHYRSAFAPISPRPFRCFTTFGVGLYDLDGVPCFNAHPETRLWFHVPAGPQTFRAEIAILDGAYDEHIPYADRTDGIEVVLTVEGEGSAERELLFSRRINPRDNPAHRGMQTLEGDFVLPADAVIQLRIGPGPRQNIVRDWTVLRKFEIRRKE